MIEFITNPVVEILDDTWNVLREDFIVKYYDTTFIIPAGFVTDLASVPRIPVFYAIVANKGKKAAVIHDWLYQEKILSRKQADKAFYDALEAQGVDWVTKNIMYSGVRIGGQAYWDKA